MNGENMHHRYYLVQNNLRKIRGHMGYVEIRRWISNKNRALQ
jgi:hypothetical protein